MLLAGGEQVVTSCRWRQMKVITPDGEDSKVIYVFSQVGRQQLEQAGAAMTTDLSTSASRFEFITIQEILQAQRVDDLDEPSTAQWLRCEEDVLEAAMQLKRPFHKENIERKMALAIPFAVHYFAHWQEDEGPIIALPVSLFSGEVALNLLPMMREYPLTVDGLSVAVEPNIALPDAFAVAARRLEAMLANEETGRTGLIWCDTASSDQRHRRRKVQEKQSFRWDHLTVEGGGRQILGLQPVEYLSLAVIMVPFCAMVFREPVGGCQFGILDPVAENMYLTEKDIGI